MAGVLEVERRQSGKGSALRAARGTGQEKGIGQLCSTTGPHQAHPSLTLKSLWAGWPCWPAHSRRIGAKSQEQVIRAGIDKDSQRSRPKDTRAEMHPQDLKETDSRE